MTHTGPTPHTPPAPLYYFAEFVKSRDELDDAVDKAFGELDVPVPPAATKPGLQIFSLTPFEAITKQRQNAIYAAHVLKETSDPTPENVADGKCYTLYDLVDSHHIENGVAHSVQQPGLRVHCGYGSGDATLFDRLYGVFSAIPGTGGEFERVVHRIGEQHTVTERLGFSETGREVTLTCVLNSDPPIEYFSRHFHCQKADQLEMK